jgi:hypothetical protein
MNLDTLESLLKESLRAIRLCLENDLCNSATVLFYCGIDTAISLDLAFDDNSVQLRYTKWCDTYMLKNETYDFTSLELYSARCGMVHETSGRSNLTEQGKAREIIYAWGDSDVALLPEMNEVAQMNDCVAVQFEDLVRSGLLHSLVFLSRPVQPRQDPNSGSDSLISTKKYPTGLLDLETVTNTSICEGCWLSFPSPNHFRASSGVCSNATFTLSPSRSSRFLCRSS